MSEGSYTAGIRHLGEHLGEEPAQAFRERLAALHPDLERYVTGFIFGEVRNRPGLDRRTQALCVVAVLAAVGGPAQLAANISYALAAGATPAEIDEVLLLVGPYAGFPKSWNALKIARQVMRARPEASDGQ